MEEEMQPNVTNASKLEKEERLQRQQHVKKEKYSSYELERAN